jgi:hypothetical protein
MSSNPLLSTKQQKKPADQPASWGKCMKICVNRGIRTRGLVSVMAKKAQEEREDGVNYVSDNRFEPC